MNRRGFLLGALATPLIVPSVKLELTNTLIRRPALGKGDIYLGTRMKLYIWDGHLWRDAPTLQSIIPQIEAYDLPDVAMAV